MSRNPSAFSLLPGPVSRLQDFVLDRIVQQVGEMCAPGWNWSVVVHTLACALSLNKLELAAWMQVLGKALLGEKQDSHLSAVQFSAYLAKSLLNPASVDAAWSRQSEAFEADYQVWLLSHGHCTQLSSRQLHIQFLQLYQRPARHLQPTLNHVVYSLVQETGLMMQEDVSAERAEGLEVGAPLLPQTPSWSLI